MDMKAKKVYLDYNVWEDIEKNPSAKTFFQNKKDWGYYLSDAHFEELNRARQNEISSSIGMTDKLKGTMLSMSIEGIIEPSLGNSALVFHPEKSAVLEAINRIEVVHDTREIMYELAQEKKDNYKDSKYQSIIGIEGVTQENEFVEIWNTANITQEINNYNQSADQIAGLLTTAKINPNNAGILLGQAWYQTLLMQMLMPIIICVRYLFQLNRIHMIF